MIDEAREKFMTVVYDELSDDSDNCRANRIIDAADEYVEERRESNKRVYDKLKVERAMFDDSRFLLSNYEAGYDDGIKKAIDILNEERDSDGRE